MNFVKFLSAVCLLIFAVACNNAPDRPEPILDPTYEPAVTTTTSSTLPPTNTTGTNSSVPHYKCPSNCVGGGAPSAGNCPICV